MARFMTLDFADGDRPQMLARVIGMVRGAYGYVVTPNVDHVVKLMDGRVGREVYVRSKNVAAGTIQLSQPLWGAVGTRTYTFRRFKYMLDFSDFDLLSRFEITDMEFQCNGFASGILLPVAGFHGATQR